MQFSQIALFGLVGMAVATPVHHKRTAAQIEADIATVSSDLTSFDNSINKFTGTLLQALSLLSSYNTLSSAIEAATSEITSTGTLSSTDSTTIYTDVEDLTAQITTTLSDAVAKASAPSILMALSFSPSALKGKTCCDGLGSAGYY